MSYRFLVAIFFGWSLAGCSRPQVKSETSVAHAYSRSVSSIETPECSPPCSSNQVCINQFASFGVAPSAVCVQTPAEAPIADFILPFDAKTEAICTHSSGSGSHSSANAYFALDLATDYSQPAAIVHAAASGTAYVLFGEDGKLCPEQTGSPAHAQSSNCGDSWGNRIMILHKSGYASFYVHLDRPLVKDGAFVRKGDPIGVEGWTGAAGHRHLHWSVQKIPGANMTECRTHISEGWSGTSVPFRFVARQNSKIQSFESSEVHCGHAGIGQVPSDQQPRFKGVP